MSTPVQASDPAVQTSLAFLHDLLGHYHPRDFSLRLWDGTSWAAEPGQPTRFTMVLQHPGALRKMFWPPNEISLSEAYVYDDFDIEGDIEAAFPLGDYLLNRQWGVAERLRYGAQLLGLPTGERPRAGRQAAQLTGPVHSRERDRQAVTYHYDVSNDFYALWLGKWMVYTCAYFASPDADLDTAQERKLEYICRKLRLRPGQRLLDVGCGWGGLIIYAAQRYGVEALGITLSRPQAELATERIREAGVADRCRVEVCDYRDVKDPEGYDRLVSVGMFEHLQRTVLPHYFEWARELLRPRGAFLNHGIAWSLTTPGYDGPTFNDRYLFPDSDVVPINTALRAAEEAGLEVRDVESLREHYRLTTRHWLRRLEAKHEEIRRLTDEATYRVWRLATAGVSYRFRTGRLNLYQALLVKPDGGESGLPLTRADWYA